MLIINNLSKTYANGVKALDGINLTIATGMFGLLGPNGAGKSSLMKIIATLLEADEGKVLFNGIDVHLQPQSIRSLLGYLPQEFGVYPRISAQDLLHHLAILKGIVDKTDRNQQVDALLQQTNLYQSRKKSVHTFSGGMRQRFGIAQALLGNPKLIIVDEPTAGLDPEERNRFLNLLSEIGENIVVILSTHIVDDVHDLCPRMAILAKGRLILEGAPADLIHALDGKIWQKPVQKSAIEDYRQKNRIISTHLHAGDTHIRLWADQRPDNGFVSHPPNLEDVYFSALLNQSTEA